MLCQTATYVNVTLQKVLDIVIRVFVEVNVLIITVLSSTSSAAWTAGDVTPLADSAAEKLLRCETNSLIFDS